MEVRIVNNINESPQRLELETIWLIKDVLSHVVSTYKLLSKTLKEKGDIELSNKYNKMYEEVNTAYYQLLELNDDKFVNNEIQRYINERKLVFLTNEYKELQESYANENNEQLNIEEDWSWLND